MAGDKLQQSYEDVPYAHLSYPQTHPDRLGMLATIMGMQPAPVTDCRVLELGCAVGGNIIPMAYGLPESRFLGIDFSPGQIRVGQNAIDNLGLNNINLMQADILSLSEDIGEFDYIIAHGVYSWTPEPVRERLMQICKENLAPDGVAYVSFNAYPGWRMQGTMRDMMLYHTRHIEKPRDRLEKAQNLIGFLAKSVNVKDQYGVFLNAYTNLLNVYNQFDIQRRRNVQEDEFGLLHDDLEEVNDAFYFHEVVEHASRHELQYLIDADFSKSMISNLKQETAETLLNMSKDVIALEQYMDFLRNCNFRQILLCHKEIDVNRSVKADESWLSKLYAASHARPVTDKINIQDNSNLKFQSTDDAEFSTDHPVTKAALIYLFRSSPKSISLPELLDEVVQGMHNKESASPDKTAVESDTLILLDNLLSAFSVNIKLVELRLYEPPYTTTASEKPLASRIAQWQAQHGLAKVTNLRHEMLDLLHLSGFLLPYLNGENDRDALLKIMHGLVQQEAVTLTDKDGKVTDEETIHKILKQELEKNLQWLGRVALLES
ncbi:MAG: methyltransferase regulatory domain-containing protein [Candidatus Brocadiales bacterium]|nr:methyltransferase regulatory domain-containing protein [Candidatus Brocadiales bacterium]